MAKNISKQINKFWNLVGFLKNDPSKTPEVENLIKNLEDFTKRENTDEAIIDLPSGYLDNVYLFIDELADMSPEDQTLNENVQKQLDKIKTSAKEINVSFDTIKTLEKSKEKTPEVKHKEEILGAFRFVGLDIIKQGDTFVAGNNDKFLKDAKGNNIVVFDKQTTLDTLNGTNLEKVSAQAILRTFQKECEELLRDALQLPANAKVQFSENDYDNDEKMNEIIAKEDKIQEVLQKYDVRSSDFKAFMLTDKHMSSLMLEDYVKSELIANSCQVNFTSLESNNALKSSEALTDLLDTKYQRNASISNSIINKCQETLNQLTKEKEDLENFIREEVAEGINNFERFAVIKEIEENIGQVKREMLKMFMLNNLLEKNNDILSKLNADQSVKLVNHVQLTLNSGTGKFEPAILGGLDDVGLSINEINQITETIRSMDFDNISYNRSEKIVESNQAQQSRQSSKLAITDFAMLRKARNISMKNTSTTANAVDNVFSNMEFDSWSYNISKIDVNKEYSYEEITQIIGTDPLEFIKDDKIQSNIGNDNIKDLEDLKKDPNKKMKFSQEFIDLGKSNINRPETINSYGAIVRYKNKLISEGKNIEDISGEDFNKGLEESIKDIQTNPLTDKEKDQVEKLKNKNRCLNLNEQLSKEKTTDAVKKFINEQLKSEELSSANKELNQELQESRSTFTYNRTFAEINGLVEKDGLAKKLKGYNKGYISKFIDDIIKIIKKTKVREEHKEESSVLGNQNPQKQQNPQDGSPNPKNPTDDPQTPPPGVQNQVNPIISFLMSIGKISQEKVRAEINRVSILFNQTVVFLRDNYRSLGISEDSFPEGAFDNAIDGNGNINVSVVQNLINIQSIQSCFVNVFNLLLDRKTFEEILKSLSQNQNANVNENEQEQNNDNQDGIVNPEENQEETPESTESPEENIIDPSNSPSGLRPNVEESEIDKVIAWLEGHKDAVLQTSNLVDRQFEINDMTRKAWLNLAAMCGNSNERLGKFLEAVASGNDSHLRTLISRFKKFADQQAFLNKDEKISQVANDLNTYFNTIVNEDSEVLKAFREIICNNENEFKFDPNINYIELIRSQTTNKKEEIESKNENYFNGVIADIKKLKELVGDKEAMDMLGRLATASEVKIMDDGKTTQLMQEREYVLGKVNGESFNCLFKINPQVLLSVLSAFPNSVLGYDEKDVMSEQDCVNMLTVSAFDQDYNIQNNIDTLVAVIGENNAYNYIEALHQHENSRSAVINNLSSKINLPLDYLHNADQRKLQQILVEFKLKYSLNNTKESAGNSNEGELLP